MVKISSKSKGFLHAVDAALASLVLLFFIGSMFATPSSPDWDPNHLRKSGGDILSAMDESNVLEDIITRKDDKSFSAIVNALSPNLEYSLEVTGIKYDDMRIINLLDDSRIYNLSTESGDYGGTGLPSASYRRKGTFDGINFVLSGEAYDGEVRYRRVNFDTNGNNVFNDTPEEAGENFNGHSQSSIFLCETVSTPTCNNSVYRIRIYNKRLFLYNASFCQELNKRITPLKVRDVRMDITCTSANPEIDSLASDTLIARKWPTSELKQYSGRIESYIRNGGTFIPMNNLTRTDVDDFYDQFEFRWEEVPVVGSGEELSNFTYPEVGNLSYSVYKYFNKTPISLNRWDTVGDTDFKGHWDYNITSESLNVSEWLIKGIKSNKNEYLISNITLSGNLYHLLFVNSSLSQNYDELYLSEDTNFSDESPVHASDQFTVPNTPNNNYVLHKVNPLQIMPPENHLFGKLRSGRVEGNDDILISENYYYDTSGVDVSENTDPGLPTDYEGIPSSECPYKHTNSINIEGEIISAVLTDQNISGCNGDYDYVNFDFNGDDTYNDKKEGTDLGYGKEGIYVKGDLVEVNESYYILDTADGGNTLYLNYSGGEKPSAIPSSANIYTGKGSVFLFPNKPMGADEYSLLKAIIFSQTMKGSDILTKSEKTSGENSVSVNWFGDLDSEVHIPYKMETKWWYS